MSGSSPRMRGALSPHIAGIGFLGIIPAYAGSTLPDKCMHVITKDHPRVCGEHCGSIFPNRRQLGSSPRMRGAPATLSVFLTFAGIIPAYAGSTPSFIHPFNPQWDHPRVCGEHAFNASCIFLTVGSSPRMRGAHASGKPRPLARRIIPAYAGSTM